MKKVISFLLALGMVISMIPTNVFAVESTEVSLTGKTISILGDSISTFKDYIPTGNATYYPQNNVQNVSDTWWMQLVTELGAKLGINESWSGSCVSVTSGERLPMASLDRIQNLDNNGTPDVILFFGGTNDIAFFSKSTPIGSFDATTAPVQADLTQTEWKTFADGYVSAILRLQHFYPEAQIISILPTINTKYYNNATLEQYNSVMRAICMHYAVEYVDLVAEGYTTNLLGDATHPNAAGMDFITAAVKKVITNPHTHNYTAAVTAPTCAEQGYTTYTCSCGESYRDNYVDATGNHSYENGTCTICGAIEPETPNDCADGHQFGDWTEHISDVCRKHYVRECLACGEKQRAKDISAQTIPFAIPAITANVGDLVNLSLYSVAFDASSVVPAAELTWSGEAVEDGCVIPSAAGVYALTASSGANSKTIYLVVKNPEDTEYVLYFDDFNDASLNGYRAIEVPSGTEYYVSDGKLVLDATGNSTNHMRILLPEWIGNFGDYEITTTFSMLSAMADTYWFATMARIQNTDFPYWQAAIRQNATTSNGVEISTRTKASGASSGWTVTHKGAFSEKLSKSKYYQQTFTLSGNKATHAINGSVILSSDSMTFATGDVGFHLRACKVSVDSIKIVIPADDIAHSYGKWETIREPNCTEKGEQIRSCSNCGVTETGEIDALGHDLTPHAAKMPTCTDSGWMAYETCNRCSHSTFTKEIEPLGHVFDRSIHSVAHRGYSVDAPENTLVAYRMAKEKGFTYVECDVAFTADGIPVLLHDNTISRTSDGTGKISELTYEQLLAYDFGSWKDAKYAGTKIPTFEEFISLCAELGLHPYIELKSNGGYTQKSVQTLVNIVEQYGLTANSTWISFESTYLTYVKKASPTARLGYLYSYDASQTAISTAQKLLSGSNEVFLNLKYTSITEAGILRAASNGFAVEAWTVNDAQELLQLPGYVSGITSDTLIAEAIVKNVTITPPTCTSQGYTTYTCSCGETYVGDYVDATGIHSYENGVCVHCGTWEENTIVITKQPVSDYALIGEKATISVEAQGDGLSYQWYYRDLPGGSLTKSTITKSVYTLTVKASNVNRELYCVITDAQGNKVTTKTVKLLLPLAEELKIITQPTPDYARIGEKATISMEVQGVGLSYQWYYRDLPNGSLTKSTITAREYSLTVKASNVNREVYCVITDAHGNQITTETVKLLQPLEPPLKILTQPTPDYAHIGEKATVFVEAQGDGLSYQWYYRDLPSGSLTKSTITTSEYSLTVKASNVNRELYCVITDAHGNKITTETVKLLQPLNPKLEIIRQPSPAYAAIGEKANVFVEAQGDGLSYQWYYRDSAKGVLYKSSITSSNYCITVTKTNIQRVLYCVITDAHGNTVTTKTVKLVGDPADPNRPVYYASLNDALKGEAGSNSPEGAVVEVLQENGETIVTLLQDAVLTETLTIASKITLDLNKYTIHSTASPAISVEADHVTIRGGNVSLTASGAGTSNSPSVAVLANSGSVLEMYDVMVTAIDAENGTVVGVMGKENSELKITGSTVIVTAETSLMNVGVHAYGPAILTDCTVIAESNYTGNKAGTAYASHAYGIFAEKDLTLKNCYVWGPHSGVCAKGKTLVDGGTYEGYGHGAFYFAGSNTTAYVYNASVNWAEMREGTYADTIAGTNGAGMYVGGGAKNVSVYMDNCQIYGTLYGIVLRNSGGETNNSIYISNSTFTGCQSYAYRNGHNANNGTLRVYAGVGVNYSAITGKISKFPNYYYETDESYA